MGYLNERQTVKVSFVFYWQPRVSNLIVHRRRSSEHLFDERLELREVEVPGQSEDDRLVLLAEELDGRLVLLGSLAPEVVSQLISVGRNLVLLCIFDCVFFRVESDDVLLDCNEEFCSPFSLPLFMNRQNEEIVPERNSLFLKRREDMRKKETRSFFLNSKSSC